MPVLKHSHVAVFQVVFMPDRSHLCDQNILAKMGKAFSVSVVYEQNQLQIYLVSMKPVYIINFPLKIIGKLIFQQITSDYNQTVIRNPIICS